MRLWHFSRRPASLAEACGGIASSDRDPLWRRLDEERHDLAREAAQALAAARTPARAAAVDQDVPDAAFSQRLEPLRDVGGCSVHRTYFVYRPRIAGGPVRPAMNGAVG